MPNFPPLDLELRPRYRAEGGNLCRDFSEFSVNTVDVHIYFSCSLLHNLPFNIGKDIFLIFFDKVVNSIYDFTIFNSMIFILSSHTW